MHWDDEICFISPQFFSIASFSFAGSTAPAEITTGAGYASCDTTVFVLIGVETMHPPHFDGFVGILTRRDIEVRWVNDAVLARPIGLDHL